MGLDTLLPTITLWILGVDVVSKYIVSVKWDKSDAVLAEHVKLIFFTSRNVSASVIIVEVLKKG